MERTRYLKPAGHPSPLRWGTYARTGLLARPDFPDLRENTGNFVELGTKALEASPKSRRKSNVSAWIPYAVEQGIILGLSENSIGPIGKFLLDQGRLELLAATKASISRQSPMRGT